MEIFVTKEFEKHHQKLPRDIQRKAEKQTNLFKVGIFQTSLLVKVPLAT